MAKDLKLAGKREVAEQIAEMFGICITQREADRFLDALAKIIKELEK